MGNKIFLLDENSDVQLLSESKFGSESELQLIIEKFSEVMSQGASGNLSTRKWLLAKREQGVPSGENESNRWYLDHLFLDQDAIPTIIEVKRSTDTRLRREVVGQVIEYGANAVSNWNAATIRSSLQARLQTEGVSTAEALQNQLDYSGDETSFWNLVETNLRAGRIRLVFISDLIPSELERMIEFMNEQFRLTEVLGIELKLFESGSKKMTLVPRIIGQSYETQQKETTSASSSSQTEKNFFDVVRAECDPDAEQVARRLLEWCRARFTRIWFGSGNFGSFVPVINQSGRDHQPFAVFPKGSIEIYFYWFQYKEPFSNLELRNELREMLNSIPGVSITEDKLAKRPNIKIDLLKPEPSFQLFTEIFDWYLAKVKEFAPNA